VVGVRRDVKKSEAVGRSRWEGGGNMEGGWGRDNVWEGGKDRMGGRLLKLGGVEP